MEEGNIPSYLFILMWRGVYIPLYKKRVAYLHEVYKTLQVRIFL